jgi:hypothetical protein
MASRAPSPYESLYCVQEQISGSMDSGPLLSRHAWHKGVGRHKTASTAAEHRTELMGSWMSSTPMLSDDVLSQWPMPRCRLALTHAWPNMHARYASSR